MKLLLLREFTKPGQVEKLAQIVDEKVVKNYADWTSREPNFYTAVKPGLRAWAFDPNIFDCPRCGGEGGWEDDWDHVEVCSLCKGRGRIDLFEVVPSDMSEAEAELIGEELAHYVRVWGHVFLAPSNYLYWLTASYRHHDWKDRLEKAYWLEERGEREKAIKKITGLKDIAGELKEDLTHLKVWEETE